MTGPSVYGGSRIQGTRQLQEDEFGFFTDDTGRAGPPALLAIVADGMGGVPGGRLASRLVVDTFAHAFLATPGAMPDRLNHALRHANRELAIQGDHFPELRGMGTTVLAGCFTADGLYWINVGDCVLWLYREGRLQRLNEDHSYRTVLYDKVQQGEITADEARSSPHRHTLMSAVTGGVIPIVEVRDKPMKLRPTDTVILASNGIHTLSTAQVQTSLAQIGDQRPKLLAELLVKAIEQRAHPYQDNATVLVVRHRA